MKLRWLAVPNNTYYRGDGTETLVVSMLNKTNEETKVALQYYCQDKKDWCNVPLEQI